MHGTRVTKQNMGTLAGNLNISVEEFDEEMSKSYREFKRKQDKEWAIEFFHKDEKWYKETKKKVEKIRKTLPKDISAKEEVIKLYGWIETKKNFSIPLMTDEKYVNAWCIEMVLTNPDAYLNSQKWD